MKLKNSKQNEQLTSIPLSSAEPYKFLVKLRNIKGGTNYARYDGKMEAT
jgi:hypothetical protein